MVDAQTPDASRAADRQRGALMLAAQAGDQAAYATLLRDCVLIVRSVARRQGVSPDRVDDVVQETLLSIHKARHTYNADRSFTGWLFAIARRRAVDSLRGTARHRRREVHDAGAYEAFPDAAPAADRTVERAQAKETLGAAIQALPAGQREAVERLVLEDRSLAEAAAVTGRQTGALKVNLHRALKALRARLGGADPGPEG